jgi:hypothetical protein
VVGYVKYPVDGVRYTIDRDRYIEKAKEYLQRADEFFGSQSLWQAQDEIYGDVRKRSADIRFA